MTYVPWNKVSVYHVSIGKGFPCKGPSGCWVYTQGFVEYRVQVRQLGERRGIELLRAGKGRPNLILELLEDDGVFEQIIGTATKSCRCRL